MSDSELSDAPAGLVKTEVHKLGKAHYKCVLRFAKNSGARYVEGFASTPITAIEAAYKALADRQQMS